MLWSNSFGYWHGGMQETVLVVEGKADKADLLLHYSLRKAGFEVLIAKVGVTGLEMARGNRPDIIDLNLLLPHTDSPSARR